MKREIREEVLNVVKFTSNYKDFKGTSWQNAYFELLSWKNTWNKALAMDINSTYDHKAYLYLVVKERDAELTRNMLEGLGYGNIKELKTKTLQLFVDVDSNVDDDIDMIFADWD